MNYKRLSLNGIEIKSLSISGKQVWHKEDEPDYFSITPEDDIDLGVVKVLYWCDIQPLDHDELDLQYSFDKSEWFDWDGENVTVLQGQTLFIRGDNETWYKYDDETGDEIMYEFYVYPLAAGSGGFFACGGSIMTLLDRTGRQDYVPDYCFNFAPFFDFGTYIGLNITKAPELPARTLGVGCYSCMFNTCMNLTVPPSVLPAEEAKRYCYGNMFESCFGLQTAPKICATTLAEGCFCSMFSCTDLRELPDMNWGNRVLPAQCYSSMFSSSGISHTPEMTIDEAGDECCAYMFMNSPVVDASKITLNDACKSSYQLMFFSCSALTKAPQMNMTRLYDNSLK